MGKNKVQAKQWLDKYYLDADLLETMVKKWYADFKCGCTNTTDAKCSGHPNSAVDPENIHLQPNKNVLMIQSIVCNCFNAT